MPAHRLTVNVVDTAGRPISGAVVRVEVSAPSGSPAAVPSDAGLVLGAAQEVTTGAAGVAEFNLLPLAEKYALRVKGQPEYAPVHFVMPDEDATLGEAVAATKAA